MATVGIWILCPDALLQLGGIIGCLRRWRRVIHIADNGIDKARA